MRDDGKGPYRYCQDGNSRCLDVHCACVNSRFYRSKYRRARGETRAAILEWWPWLVTIAVLACGAWLSS